MITMKIVLDNLYSISGNESPTPMFDFTPFSRGGQELVKCPFWDTVGILGV